MSIRFACSRSEFKPWISLLIFCLVDLSNIDSGVLKSYTIIVWESQSLCKLLLVSKNLFTSTLPLLFTQSLFRSRFFSFHVVVQVFVSLLILSSNFIALWSERVFIMISILLHLLRSVLLSIIWSILE